MVQFANSNYRFTDPIRYFKANDPIYYEVDNIPLKQLQENDLWIKDQLEKLEYTQIFNTTSVTNNNISQFLQANRAGFTELQPYVNNSDNVVYVKPGRYTARINDALNLQPLQIIAQLDDNEFFTNGYEYKTNRDATLRAVLTKFTVQLEANAAGMNGLIERAFTRASRNLEQVSQYLNISAPRYDSIPQGTVEIPYPSKTGQTHIYNLAVNAVSSNLVNNSVEGLLTAPWHESNFIKKWRGIARTAVVDIQNELSIAIPPFSQEDFYYINSNGQRITLNSASQRIDLLFIYSKPVDASAASIAKFPTGATTPTKIYSPQLGIVKGAGVGLTLRTSNFNSNTPLNSVDLQDADGNQMIIPSISDQLGANIGFSGVKGSFPSPDDLLNLAPTLSERLEDNNIALLGQSILPIAYIVVKSSASPNAAGTPILNSEDIIDIRPFFRTAELAYNERAGIAAAHPQISIANPVATEAYVDLVAKNLRDQFPTVPTGPGPGGLSGVALVGGTVNKKIPRVIGGGYILGGANYGPEKVLSKYLISKNSGMTIESSLSRVRSDFLYPEGRAIPYDPDWDLATWATELFPGNAGTQRNDWLNYIMRQTGTAASNWQAQYEYSIDSNDGMGEDWFQFFVAKKIVVDISDPSLEWVKDIKVNLNYFNCTPISTGVRTHSQGLHYSKFKNGSTVEIYIYAFVPNNEAGDAAHPRLRRSNAGIYNSYFVTAYPLFREPLKIGNGQGFKGPNGGGFCQYPSVSFEIIGIPEYLNVNQDLKNNITIVAR